MKTEFTDVSETQKTLAVEIPTDVVEAEIGRIAKDYTRKARVPGFRPGKVPASVVKQRFRDEILHDVVHGLIPRAVEEALQERGIEPVETPNIKDVNLREGHPLTFTASIETVPSFDPGDLSTLTATRPSSAVGEEAVDEMLKRLQQRAAKYESIEGRPVGEGDTVTLDIERRDATSEPDRHQDVTLHMGAEINPPGFDAQLLGLNIGDTKTFPLQCPADYSVTELAGTEVTYTVTVKELRRRVVPAIDDELAKDLGEFDSLAALRARVRADLEAEAAEQATRQVRSEILKQLADRVSFQPPPSMVEHEIDRRLEEFARQLVQQNVDPRQAGIDWAQFREAQREPARAAVASALALDEVARRESLTVTPEDVDIEVERFAVRAGRTSAALRAQLEKEGGMSRLQTGLRREKAVDLALSRARIVEA
jgi:trigger factor